MRHGKSRSGDRYHIVSALTSDYTYALRVEDGRAVTEWATGAVQRITGYTPEELDEIGAQGLVHPDDAERVRAHLEAVISGQSRVAEFRIRTKDGRERWLQDHAHPVRKREDGPVHRIHGAVRDITDRRLAEEALRESEERFRRFVENSFDAIVEVDLGGQVLYASPSVERITGNPAEALLGHSFFDFTAPEHRKRLVAQFARLAAGEVVEHLHLSFRNQNGKEVGIDVNAWPVLEGERVVGAQAIVRDVTEQQRLEQQLRHMQKMEAIGTLAGGVAHDFNNLLTGILGYANLLRRLTEPDSEIHRGVEVIEQAAARAAALTEQLLGFARRGKVRSQPVDLHATVREVTALLGRTIDPRIAVNQNLEAESCCAEGDPGQLQQVVLNLAVNARDAMPQGGEMTLATEVVEVQADRRGLQPGPHLCLTVGDTGTGIPDDIRGRIFEPFFSTKPPGQGSGMGLAMAYGIVHNHGGLIEVESREGRGSSFRVLLPLSRELARPAAGEAHAARGAGRILLVDDEQVVCTVITRMLRGLGYQVSVASDGEQALELFRPGEVDLVILDLIMPGMGGSDCFHALRRIAPEQPVLLCTGHALGKDTRQILSQKRVGFLRKPFVQADLARSVARLLQRGEIC